NDQVGVEHSKIYRYERRGIPTASFFGVKFNFHKSLRQNAIDMAWIPEESDVYQKHYYLPQRPSRGRTF
ncbi:hypothetical protein, partial [Gelidibacter pelagius]